MAMTVTISLQSLLVLDLSPVAAALAQLGAGELASSGQQLRFQIDYPREPDDPRELSEVPEVRLWFIRLDSRYPWLPWFLDWQAGELARYAAMLVPHQFSRQEGIQYNPEALEIFVMGKIFVLADWMKSNDIKSLSTLKSMAQMLGYELDDTFFEAIDGSS
ncbi:MAG: CRR6 family NdhI maturation factor [Cyanosarcina radialis HA8281-LM2]|jgi:hypothetical protein|nr:CRR6 family NdhI maturation factor [Cyanosarcina radialis HA8281-LM2]